MITRVRGKGEIQLRAFALTDMVKWGYQGLRGIGPVVSESAMRGIPAINRAARLRAEAIACLDLCCYSGEPPDREKRDGVWQQKLFDDPANEYQTRFGFWETVEESLAYRNNAYVWKNTDPSSGRVVQWWALHPDQVGCRSAGVYDVEITSGYVDPVGRGPGRYVVGTDTILHIRGHGYGGMIEAPTPIQIFQSALASPVGRQSSEANMWARGTALRLAVLFPENKTRDQVSEWRHDWKATYEGSGGEGTAVLGGGADIKPIGMTAVDAEYVAFAKLTVEDASRIMSVPANLLGVQLDRAVPNLEQDLATWLRFGLEPELNRIEDALVADEELFGGSHTYPRFDTDDFVRGDITAETNQLVALVQAGIITPDEARAARGQGELPDGLGAIPQVTPVGGAPNPNAMPMAATNGNAY